MYNREIFEVDNFCYGRPLYLFVPGTKRHSYFTVYRQNHVCSTAQRGFFSEWNSTEKKTKIFNTLQNLEFYFFYCFTVHFNLLNVTHQLMHFQYSNILV